MVASRILVRHPLRLLASLVSLFVLACQTRFRTKGRYWRWRDETAFGNDPARRPDAAARRQAMLEYGLWVHRMKRL